MTARGSSCLHLALVALCLFTAACSDAPKEQEPRTSTATTDRRGLGVTRRQATGPFAEPAGTFRFQEGERVAGRPSLLGRSDSLRGTLLQFVGGEEEIERAILTLPNFGQGADRRQSRLLDDFLRFYDPRASTWVGLALARLDPTAPPPDTTLGERRYQLQLRVRDTLALLSVTVAPAP